MTATCERRSSSSLMAAAAAAGGGGDESASCAAAFDGINTKVNEARRFCKCDHEFGDEIRDQRSRLFTLCFLFEAKNLPSCRMIEGGAIDGKQALVIDRLHLTFAMRIESLKTSPVYGA